MIAEMAALALGSVDDGTEGRETREETQSRTHRADRVAIGSSVLPGQDHHCHQGDKGDDESRETLEPDLLGVEGVALMLLSDRCEQVVAPLPDGRQEVLYDPTPSAVWRQKGDKGIYASD